MTGSTPIVRTLPHGVRLLAIPMPHVQSASVGVFVRVGSRDETPATNGIGHVLEHMAFKGTATRSVQEINLDAERLGADVNAWTSKDTTGYFMTGLGRHAGDFLRMLADIVLASTFPPAELEREREVIRQEAIEYAEDPEDRSSELLDRALWGGHPMGMPVIGTVHNIERFSRDDLVRHVHSHQAAGNTVVAAAGNFDPEAFLALAAQLFGGMRPGRPSGDPVPPPHAGAAIAERFSQVSQCFVNIAYPLAPARPDELPLQPWRAASSVAALLFGGGMSSPFTDTIRERLGLAYSAAASTELGDVFGSFIVHAVTTPDKLDALFAATGDLLGQQARAIDPVHLERARNQAIVSRARSCERPYATMERAVEELFVRGHVTSLADQVAALESVDAGHVRDVFARMLRHSPAVAITGKGATARAAKQLAATLAARSTA